VHPRDWPDALDGATHEPWDEREASGWLVARNEAAPWSPARLGPTRKEPILGTREWARYQANMARPQSPNALRMHAHALETAGEGGGAGFGGGGEGGGGGPVFKRLYNDAMEYHVRRWEESEQQRDAEEQLSLHARARLQNHSPSFGSSDGTKRLPAGGRSYRNDSFWTGDGSEVAAAVAEAAAEMNAEADGGGAAANGSGAAGEDFADWPEEEEGVGEAGYDEDALRRLEDEGGGGGVASAADLADADLADADLADALAGGD